MTAHRELGAVARATCAEGHCITCADEATPMTVVKVDPHRGLALCVDGDEHRSSIETALVEPVVEGDRLLVHAGTAIAALKEPPASVKSFDLRSPSSPRSPRRGSRHEVRR